MKLTELVTEIMVFILEGWIDGIDDPKQINVVSTIEEVIDGSDDLDSMDYAKTSYRAGTFVFVPLTLKGDSNGTQTTQQTTPTSVI